MAHIRQSRPDSGLGFQVKALEPFPVVPSSLGSGAWLYSLAVHIVYYVVLQTVHCLAVQTAVTCASSAVRAVALRSKSQVPPGNPLASHRRVQHVQHVREV